MNWNPIFHAAAASVTYAESPMIHIGNIRAVFPGFRPKRQKRRRGAKPLLLDSLYPGSLPASSLSPKISERLGSCPYSWEILSQPCPLDTSRTPYRTSGLPAGAEPSFESKDIIASTNPKCPDTFEYNRTTQLHGYEATWLRKGKNTGSHRCSDRWRDHAGSTSIEFSTVDRD